MTVKREGGKELYNQSERVGGCVKENLLCPTCPTRTYIKYYVQAQYYVHVTIINPICSELSGTQAGIAGGTIKNDTSTGQKKGLVNKHYEIWRYSYISTCR